MLKSLRTVELFKILAINLPSVDQGKEDPLDLVGFLAWGCSSNLGLLSGLELSGTIFISPDAGPSDDLDAGLNFHGDMVFLSRVCSGFVNGEQFKTLLNLRGEAGMVLLFLTGDVLIVGKDRNSNWSVTLFSENEAHMSDNGQNYMIRTARRNQHFWKSKLLSYQKFSISYTLKIY